MPGLDGTGPYGEGPMTGGGFGYCSPYWFRRGFAFRRRRVWRLKPLSKEEEKKILKEELDEIEKEKAEIEKRLKELK